MCALHHGHAPQSNVYFAFRSTLLLLFIRMKQNPKFTLRDSIEQAMLTNSGLP
jgi:hypothetical protein